MTGSHSHCVLLVTVDLRYAAVTGGGVASMFVSICSHSHNVVGVSDRRGNPGHENTVVFTGSVHHHTSGLTGLCDKEKTIRFY